MKGTLIRKNLEFTLLANGENWIQGSTIKGTLSVKNIGNEITVVPALKVVLAYGDFKKVHAKDDSSWKSIAAISFPASRPLKKEEAEIHDWQFELSTTAPITDKSGSLFLVYGEELADAETDIDANAKNGKKLTSKKGDYLGISSDCGGHLQLSVENHPIINFFVETIERFVRFKVKQKKYNLNKGWVEIKMAPPSSREWQSVEGAVLSFRVINEILEVHYLFNIKSLDLSSGVGQLAVQKKKREFTQELTPKDYQFYANSPNYDGIQAAFKEISLQVVSKLMI